MASESSANGDGKVDTLKGNADFTIMTPGPRPDHGKPATNGQRQPLTNYDSFFSDLLSWNNPRATAVTYAGIVSLILAIRFLDIIRYSFKLTWMALGITVLAEVTGKAVLGHGLVTQLRPRKYYTISRETIEAMVGDVNELANFFVIELQRILFAENITISTAAAVGAFLSYFLAGVLPYWGLALIATTVVFLAPLIYSTNQELIDHYVQEGAEMLSSQTEELRQVATKHASQATEITKQYMGDYTAKAQTLLHRGHSASPEPAAKPAPQAPQSGIRESDFPQAPKKDLQSDGSEHEHEHEHEPAQESEEEPAEEPVAA
ncbi:Reticulon-domain-containing protein [Xylaria sp. CBS 124048]|nr:Reticulon-domain-containing protein [Xylaria sp. CBS 124048]